MNNDALKHLASAIGNLGNILIAALMAANLVPTLLRDPAKAVPWSILVSGIIIWMVCQFAAVIILRQLRKEPKNLSLNRCFSPADDGTGKI